MAAIPVYGRNNAKLQGSKSQRYFMVDTGVLRSGLISADGGDVARLIVARDTGHNWDGQIQIADFGNQAVWLEKLPSYSWRCFQQGKFLAPKNRAEQLI